MVRQGRRIEPMSGGQLHDSAPPFLQDLVTIFVD
jgi:hypothetical protein